MSGTRVTCEDIETGESESAVIRDDYIIVTDGTCEITSMQVYGNGTVQLTIKRQRGTTAAGNRPTPDSDSGAPGLEGSR